MTNKGSLLVSIPSLSGFRPKIFSPAKIDPKMADFCENGGLHIKFYFENPQKAHPRADPRLLTYFVKSD